MFSNHIINLFIIRVSNSILERDVVREVYLLCFVVLQDIFKPLIKEYPQMRLCWNPQSVIRSIGHAAYSARISCGEFEEDCLFQSVSTGYKCGDGRYVKSATLAVGPVVSLLTVVKHELLEVLKKLRAFTDDLLHARVCRNMTIATENEEIVNMVRATS